MQKSRKPRRREQKTMMYKVCERCGAHLDCGEKCDCERQQDYEIRSKREREEKRNDYTRVPETRAGKAV